ncbi:Uncharacterised protein [Oligella urethralis]|nr:Uncharacterised protein [Oligella urethralis]
MVNKVFILFIALIYVPLMMLSFGCFVIGEIINLFFHRDDFDVKNLIMGISFAILFFEQFIKSLLKPD